MENPYPDESQRLDVFGHLEELRKRILICLGFFLTVAALLFSQGNWLLKLSTKPLGSRADHLIFIAPTEAFGSYLKVVLLSAFVTSFPMLLYQIWAFVKPAISASLRRNVFWWLSFSFILFAAGILFSYWILIPAALDFLLGFGTGFATPQITLSKYVSFFAALIFSGGIVFEIPVALGLLTDLGLLKAKTLTEKRQYAIVIIVMAAAIVTPTTDVVNLIIFSVPMIILYEIGIVVARVIESAKEKTNLSGRT